MRAMKLWLLLAPVRARFDALPSRERLVVAGVGSLVVMALAYLLLWQPARAFRADAEVRRQAASSVLSLLRSNEQRLRGQGAQAAGDEGSLLSLAGRVAASEGVVVTRFNPDARGSVSLVIQETDFDKLLRMLDVLERQHGIHVRQMSLTRQEDGLVAASVALQ